MHIDEEILRPHRRCRFIGPNRHQSKKSPSTSVGARVVRSGGGGPFARPRPVSSRPPRGPAVQPPPPPRPHRPPLPPPPPPPPPSPTAPPPLSPPCPVS